MIENRQVAVGDANYIPFDDFEGELGNDPVHTGRIYPLLQYATGLDAQVPIRDSEGCVQYDEETYEELLEERKYRGFFTQCNLDEKVDKVCQQLNVPYLYITHQSGETLQHWALGTIGIYLLALGLPNRYTQGEFGIISTWRKKRNGPGNETVYSAMVVIHELLPHFNRPFILTVTSTQTDDLTAAFSRQNDVLKRAHEVLKAVGRDRALPLWTFRIRLGAAKKQVKRESKTGKGNSLIYPIVSGIPDAGKIDRTYLQKYQMPVEYAGAFREYAEGSVEWATKLMVYIQRGLEPWGRPHEASTGEE